MKPTPTDPNAARSARPAGAPPPADAHLEDQQVLDAVSRSTAILELALDGTVLEANELFCRALGYDRDELVGRHHRSLCEPAFAASPEYDALWQKLRRGAHDSGVYRRVGKGGREVWIQASYNPILDGAGKPYKVVKFATDITQARQLELETQRTVAQVSEVLAAVADGDLTMMVRESTDPTYATLRHNVNGTVRALRDMVQEIRETTEAISGAAADIDAGMNDLAWRAEQQAASLEETASTMEEMSSSVEENAVSASQASKLADQSRMTADAGGAVVRQAVAAMGDIAAASTRIAEIINVIDEIAFQTNLLALNAAVEAARAGEHGRGFAVVASEVRNLSQRSASAAREIKALIRDASAKVADGTRLVDGSGQMLVRIVDGTGQVADVVGEIASASEQQARGIAEITSALAQTDEFTQQNAAMVEQAAAGMSSMTQQVLFLNELVARFVIGDELEQLPPAPRARAGGPLALPPGPRRGAVRAAPAGRAAPTSRRPAAPTRANPGADRTARVLADRAAAPSAQRAGRGSGPVRAAATAGAAPAAAPSARDRRDAAAGRSGRLRTPPAPEPPAPDDDAVPTTDLDDSFIEF